MSGTVEQVNILIVDDRIENLLAVEAILEHLGETTVCARSGREALRHLLQREFAVILLDINMPDMDGFETAKLIRQRERFKHTPIIFLTATDHDIQLLRGYSVGAVDYMLTPVQPEVLRSKVGVFVELARKNQEVVRQAGILARRAAQLQRLASASVAINLATSLGTILDAITNAARDVVGVHQALMVTSITAARSSAVRQQIHGSFSEKYQTYSDADLADQARRVAKIVGGRNTITRLTTDELEARLAAAGLEDATIARRLRGLLAAPMTDVDGDQLGMIELSDKLEGEFTDDDEAILVQLAQLGSIAVQNWLHSEAKEANRIKDEFLGTLSHELRTPLHAILGWTQHLRSGTTDPDELAHGLEVIERNANAQTRLVEDLLDVSRITSGKLGVEKKALSLVTLVEETIEAHRHAAEAKSIALAATIQASRDRVWGDPDRLRQVVSNLLANAIKFTPEGGRVHLNLASSAGVHEIRIEDTGDGIGPDLLPFIFERFRQGDTSSRRTQSGLGLGLAIVRHIVELHRGEVHVQSAGLGQGSTFVVRLPLLPVASDESNRAPVSSDLGERAQLEGVHVLVVDDDADAGEMLGRILSRQLADVTVVASASEALTAFDVRLPNVLVSELALPTEDGFDLIRRVRLRALGAGGDVPALALTASARAEDRARAIEAGFQMHAAKPIEPAALIHAVVELAARRAPVLW